MGPPVPSSPEPLIQVGIDLIRVDASVADRTGQPIVDLTRADFTVEIDGKKQPVRNVRFVSGESEPASLIFMVDDINPSFTNLFLVKDTLRSFGGRWNPAEEQVAIRLTSDKRGELTLSSSPERFAAAIDGIQYETHNAKEALQPMPPQAYPSPVDLDLSPMKVDHVVVGGELMTVDTSPIAMPPVLPVSDVQQRLYCLLSTIQGMKSLPGRKALVLVGDNLLSNGNTRMSEAGVSTPFDSLIDASSINSVVGTIVEVANRASVVIHAIEPGGLARDATIADAGAAPTAFSRSEVVGAPLPGQSVLERLARDTGGITILDYKGLKSGIGQIVADQRSYYLVGFEPPKAAFAKTSGKAKFHSLKLTVNRPDIAVRTRSGFYGVTDREIAGRRD